MAAAEASYSFPATRAYFGGAFCVKAVYGDVNEQVQRDACMRGPHASFEVFDVVRILTPAKCLGRTHFVPDISSTLCEAKRRCVEGHVSNANPSRQIFRARIFDVVGAESGESTVWRDSKPSGSRCYLRTRVEHVNSVSGAYTPSVRSRSARHPICGTFGR